MCAKSGGNHPFPILLEVEFLDRLTEPVRAGKAKSVSEIIRGALARFDLAKVVVVRPAQVLISVRLPADKRAELQREAAAKHTSVGQLVRAAVESFLPQLESGAVNQMEMAIETAPAPAASAAAPAPGRAPRAKKRRAKPKPPAPRPVAAKAPKSAAQPAPPPKQTGRQKGPAAARRPRR